MGGAHVQQAGLDRATQVRVDDRHALARVALDHCQAGHQRGLAIAGIGTDDQQRARRRVPVALQDSAEPERGMQPAQGLHEPPGRRRFAVAVDDRRPHPRQRREDLGSEEPLHAGDCPQAPIQATEQVCRHGGEDEADEKAEDRVLAGFRR